MTAVHPQAFEGYQLFHEGILALADVESNGIRIDVDYCHKQMDHLEKRIEYFKKKILEHPEGKLWKETYGNNMNFDAGDQLAFILFDKLKYKPQVFTAKSTEEKPNPSTSQAALEQIKSPIVENLTRMRRLSKARGTYIANYIREQWDGWLHPFFNLHTVTTFRSSSSNINFQNQPVRIPYIKRLVRQAVIPRPGHMLGEIDFSGVEVRVAACYHRDPNMIKDIIDPERDMHRDMAMECYKLSLDEVNKHTRYCGKNKFVFPQFYGDYYVNNARDLWDAINFMKLETKQGLPLREHLKENGISSYKIFEDHIKAVEKYFWGTRYPVYGKWKETHWEKYQKTGYVDLLTGFRCAGVMKRNEAINYPVQGAAFHCLLWCLIQMNRWLKENNMRTVIIGQIHDSIVLDIHPEEANAVLAKAYKIMEHDIREHWGWILVPLEVDTELTPVDQSWYNKDEVKRDGLVCDCLNEWLYSKEKDGRKYRECPVCGKEYETGNA